jgi:hypothetical protein
VPVVIASDQGAVAISAASLPLPTSAATEGTLATRLAEATFTGRINTQGQKTMAASTPVVIASDQSAIPITGSISASTSADVQEADDDAGYVDGDLGKNLVQTPDGRLRVAVAAKVSDSRESYVDNQVRSLSLTSDGRLRVSMSPADIYVECFVPFNFGAANSEDVTGSPWSNLL